MTRSTLALIIITAAAFSGCIDSKDVGLEGEGGTSSSGGGSGRGTSTTSSPPPATGADATESGAESVGEAGEESSGGAGGSSSGGGQRGSSTSGAETGGFGDEQDLCEFSGGSWDEGSCGHYECGAAPDCGALIPGCDCGPFSGFLPKVGCFPAVDCAVDFDCGEETCSAPEQICSVFVPGVMGAPTTYTCESTPPECGEDYTCECVDPMGADECEQAEDGAITNTTYGA